MWLALFHRPIFVRLITQLQEPVLGIMPFAARRAGQITAECCSALVVILGDGESGPATAWNEKHSEASFIGRA